MLGVAPQESSTSCIGLIMKTMVSFLGIGVGKSGTTWVHTCLAEHPEIFVPAIKEVNYFSLHYDRGRDWYDSIFNSAQHEKILGEISPTYFGNPHAPERIKHYNPQVKLIAILRDPIERAYSHYCMNLTGNLISDDIDRVLSHGTRCIDLGFYYKHLQRFGRQFDREQMKIMIYEDLKSDPLHFFRSILEFLEVDTTFEPSILNKPFGHRKNRKKYWRIYRGLVRSTQYAIHQNDYFARWFDKIRKRGYFRPVHKILGSKPFPVLSDAKRLELARLYEPDVKALETYLDRDLSFWLKT